MNKRPNRNDAVETTFGALEDIHSVVVGRRHAQTELEHDGSMHCWCDVAAAIRTAWGVPHPGSDEYQIEYGRYARVYVD